MRTILISVLFIIAAIVIYESVIGGDDGTKRKVGEAGSRMNSRIQQMSP